MNDIVGHAVVQSTEKEGYWQLNQMMDFSDGWEAALLSAHVHYRSDDSELRMQLRDSTAGKCNFFTGPHTVRTAADFMELVDFGIATFKQPPGGSAPTAMQDVLNITLAGPDKIRFTLRAGRTSCSISLVSSYTREQLGGGNVILSVRHPTHVLDLSRLRKTMHSIDIDLGDMLRDAPLLQSIPLTEKSGYHIHYEPHTVVYKEVTAAQFSRIPIRYTFNCEQNCADCTRLLRGTLELSFRRKK